MLIDLCGSSVRQLSKSITSLFMPKRNQHRLAIVATLRLLLFLQREAEGGFV